MFRGAESFNQRLDAWKVGGVTDMEYMFYEASSFNQPLHSWNVGKVESMYNMFALSAFNQPLTGWDVHSAHIIFNMFGGTPMSDCNKAATQAAFSATGLSPDPSWASLCSPPPPPPPLPPWWWWPLGVGVLAAIVAVAAAGVRAALKVRAAHDAWVAAAIGRAAKEQL